MKIDHLFFFQLYVKYRRLVVFRQVVGWNSSGIAIPVGNKMWRHNFYTGSIKAVLYIFCADQNISGPFYVSGQYTY